MVRRNRANGFQRRDVVGSGIARQINTGCRADVGQSAACASRQIVERIPIGDGRLALPTIRQRAVGIGQRASVHRGDKAAIRQKRIATRAGQRLDCLMVRPKVYAIPRKIARH
jgi:hypothetical protein